MVFIKKGRWCPRPGPDNLHISKWTWIGYIMKLSGIWMDFITVDKQEKLTIFEKTVTKIL